MDDVFLIIQKHAITNFHNLLNSIDPHINFTIEQEHNGQLSFLDTIVTRNNGSLIVNVYRKPTHTDRYLDYNSHHVKIPTPNSQSSEQERGQTTRERSEGSKSSTHYLGDKNRFDVSSKGPSSGISVSH